MSWGRYCRARYYHPGLQRFISEDPIGLEAGDSNFYVYVDNSSVNFIDPLGLEKKKKKRPQAPLAPPGVDLDANIQLTELMAAGPPGLELWWFAGMVMPGGPWDYKLQDPTLKYEPFGNFHYGATGSALGVPAPVLRRAAGLVQVLDRRAYRAKYGKPWGGFPHGDQPKDQRYIQLGMDYYQCKFGG